MLFSSCQRAASGRDDSVHMKVKFIKKQGEWQRQPTLYRSVHLLKGGLLSLGIIFKMITYGAAKEMLIGQGNNPLYSVTVVQLNFPKWWKYSCSVLLNMIATSHLWLVNLRLYPVAGDGSQLMECLCSMCEALVYPQDHTHWPWPHTFVVRAFGMHSRENRKFSLILSW